MTLCVRYHCSTAWTDAKSTLMVAKTVLDDDAADDDAAADDAAADDDEADDADATETSRSTKCRNDGLLKHIAVS